MSVSPMRPTRHSSLVALMIEYKVPIRKRSWLGRLRKTPWLFRHQYLLFRRAGCSRMESVHPALVSVRLLLKK